jgi:hypothetical protein
VSLGLRLRSRAQADRTSRESSLKSIARSAGGSITLILRVAVCVTVLSGGILADPFDGSESGFSPEGVTATPYILQGFDLRVWLSDRMVIGRAAWENSHDPPPSVGLGCEYPAGSGVEHIRGGGPWIGGIVDGFGRVTAAYVAGDSLPYFRPDPRHPLRKIFWRTSARDSLVEPNRRGCDDDGDGLIDEDDLDGTDNDGDWVIGTDDVGADGIPDIIETGCRGGYDVSSNPDPAFDNYDRSATDLCHPDANGNYRRKDDPDLYTEMNGLPDHGEPHVDEDYGAISDYDLTSSWKDDRPEPSGHVPLGVTIVQKSYSWTSREFSAVVPLEYLFINTSEKTISGVFLGFFIDADVGPVSTWTYPEHNYSCFLDTLRTAYVHNPTDQGSTPIGVTLLGEPKPLSEVGMSYRWYNRTDRPAPGRTDLELYNAMSGGVFPFPPAPGEICTDPTDLSDVSVLLSIGPFDSFAPGETLKLSVALVSGEGLLLGPNNLGSNVRRAMLLHDRIAHSPLPPLAQDFPHNVALRATWEDQDRVVLRWAVPGGVQDPREFWDLSSLFAETFSDEHWRRKNPPCGVLPGCEELSRCDSLGRLPGGRSFDGFRIFRRDTDPVGTDDRSIWRMIGELKPDQSDATTLPPLDSVFVDTDIRSGRRYGYAVEMIGLPQMQVIEFPHPGGVVYDTLFFPVGEERYFQDMVDIEIPFGASDRVGEVKVVPNPYRIDENYKLENGGWEGRSSEWSEFKRVMKFIHLPRSCTIRIYSLTGDIVSTLKYIAPVSDPDRGELIWDMTSDGGYFISSGLYVYSVESDYGTQYGKFVVIR